MVRGKRLFQAMAFIPKSDRSIHQDRLGTNNRNVETKGAFCAAQALLTATTAAARAVAAADATVAVVAAAAISRSSAAAVFDHHAQSLPRVRAVSRSVRALTGSSSSSSSSSSTVLVVAAVVVVVVLVRLSMMH
jgi:hypothetical protein